MNDFLGVAPPRYRGASIANRLNTFSYAGTLVVQNGKGRLRFPIAATLLGWSASLNTAPTGSAVSLRLNRNGTSLDTGSIAAAANFMTERSLSQAMAVGDWLTVDITAIGSTTPGSDLTVMVRWR